MSNGAQVRAGPSATYRVLRELGTRAQHSFAAIREPHELVVLHRFSKDPKTDAVTFVSPEEMALLHRDARCLMKHWHPNIARVRHVDLLESDLSVATELIDGASLHDLLAAAGARGTPLPLPLVARILVDVLGGLHGLHGLRDGINAPLGTMHGALCPTNVIVGKDGVARVVNVFRSRPAKITATSEAMAYSAPESLDPEPRQDIRSDLYAVGVMLWETLTGKRLYDQPDPARVAQRQREEDLIRPDLPETSPFAKLADVALRALAFDPAFRFRSPSEMAAEIRRVAGTRLAPGSAVAQSVLDLLGDRVRARRAELDPQLSGARRRTESMIGLEAVAPLPAPPEETPPLTRRNDDAVDLAWSDLPTADAPKVEATPTAKPPPKPASDTAETVPTAPPKKGPPKLGSDRKVSAPTSEAMPRPMPPRAPPAGRPPPPLPSRAKPALPVGAGMGMNAPAQKTGSPSPMLAAAPILQVPMPPLSASSLDELPGPRASMVDVMELIDELPPSAPHINDADVIAMARMVPVSDRSISVAPPIFAVRPEPMSENRSESPSESVPAVVAADAAPTSDPSPSGHVATPGRTQRELVVSLPPDPPNRRRFVPLVVAITTALGLLSIIAVIFTMRASQSAHAGSPPPAASSLLDPPSTQIVAPPPAPSATIVEEPTPAEAPAPSASAASTVVAPAKAPQSPPVSAPPGAAPPKPSPPVIAPHGGIKPKKASYEPLGI